MVASHPAWVLGTGCGSSGRVERALNHWATSLAPGESSCSLDAELLLTFWAVQGVSVQNQRSDPDPILFLCPVPRVLQSQPPAPIYSLLILGKGYGEWSSPLSFNLVNSKPVTQYCDCFIRMASFEMGPASLPSLLPRFTHVAVWISGSCQIPYSILWMHNIFQILPIT